MSLEDRLTKQGVHLGSFATQLYSLTASPQADRVVGAAYFIPEFNIWGVGTDDQGRPQLNAPQVVSNEVSATTEGGTYARMWKGSPQTHSAPRAGVAQLTPEGDLLVLQHGGWEIGVYRFDTEQVEHRLSPTIGLCHYFTRLSNGMIVTIEDWGGNEDGPHLRAYVHKDDRLELLAQREIGEFSIFDDVRSQGIAPNLLTGLAEQDGELMMITDERSRLGFSDDGGRMDRRGIYTLDISCGIIEALNEGGAHNPDLRFVESSRGMTGNGIAPLPDGLLIAEYGFRRDDPFLGRPSTLTYLPFKSRDHYK